MPTHLDVDNTAPTSDKVAETRFGNDICIEKGPTGRMFRIVLKGGGNLAPELSGLFCSHRDASMAIFRYVGEGKAKVREPGDLHPKEKRTLRLAKKREQDEQDAQA